MIGRETTKLPSNPVKGILRAALGEAEHFYSGVLDVITKPDGHYGSGITKEQIERFRRN